jgi:hypothetical protein
MKNLSITTLIAVAFLAFGVSASSASDKAGPQCVDFRPGVSYFDSIAPDPKVVKRTILDELTGTMARLAVYVEVPDANGRMTIEPEFRQLLIFPTSSGRHVVRFISMPPIPDWYYGYQAPF